MGGLRIAIVGTPEAWEQFCSLCNINPNARRGVYHHVHCLYDVTGWRFNDALFIGDFGKLPEFSQIEGSLRYH